MGGAAGHDCSTHDASMLLAATTAAARTDLNVKAALGSSATPDLGDFVVRRCARDSFDYAAPPGTAPPTARPVVLRV